MIKKKIKYEGRIYNGAVFDCNIDRGVIYRKDGSELDVVRTKCHYRCGNRVIGSEYTWEACFWVTDKTTGYEEDTDVNTQAK